MSDIEKILLMHGARSVEELYEMFLAYKEARK